MKLLSYKFLPLLLGILSLGLFFQNCSQPFSSEMSGMSVGANGLVELQSVSEPMGGKTAIQSWMQVESQRLQKFVSLSAKGLVSDADLDPSGIATLGHSTLWSESQECPAGAPAGSQCVTLLVRKQDVTGSSGGLVDQGYVIRKAVSHILNSPMGGNYWYQIRLEPNEYALRFNPRSYAALDFSQLRQFVFDGAGSFLMLSPYSTLMTMTDCQKCQFKNFSVDYVEPHHSQVKITGIARNSSRTIVSFEMEPGFPAIPTGGINENTYKTMVRSSTHAAVFQPNGKLDFSVPRGYVFVDKADIQPGKIIFNNNIEQNNKSNLPSVAALKVGQRLAFHNPLTPLSFYNAMTRTGRMINSQSSIYESAGYYYALFMAAFSKDLSFVNIRVNASKKMVFIPMGNEGKIVFDHFNVVPRANRGYLISSLSDGIHSNGNRATVIVKNSRFEALMDDAINLNSPAILATVKRSSSSYVLERRGAATWTIKAGDKLTLVNVPSGKVAGQLTVQSAQRVYDSSKGKYVHYVTFTSAVNIGLCPGIANVSNCDQLLNESETQANNQIINNLFINKPRTGAILGTDTLVQGNRFEHIGAGLYVTYSASILEGAIPTGLKFVANQFVDMQSFGVTTSLGNISNYLISGSNVTCNDFINMGTYALDLRDFGGVVSKNYIVGSISSMTQNSNSISITQPLSSSARSNSACSQYAFYGQQGPSATDPLPPATSEEPPSTASSAIHRGLFKVGRGIYFGFRDSYCGYGSMTIVNSVYGSSWQSVIHVVSERPTGMTYEGSCGAKQGIYRQGTGIYYVNKQADVCWVNSTDKLKNMAGMSGSEAGLLLDTNMSSKGLNAVTNANHICLYSQTAGEQGIARPEEPDQPEREPASTSSSQLGLFKVGTGIYFGFKDSYCAYGSMNVVNSVYGSSWQSIIHVVSKKPTGMTYQGYCGAKQGIYRQNTGIYYVDKQRSVCWVNSMANLKILAGLTGSEAKLLPNTNMSSKGLNAIADVNHICRK